MRLAWFQSAPRINAGRTSEFLHAALQSASLQKMPANIYTRRAQANEALRPFVVRAPPDRKHFWNGYDWTRAMAAGLVPPEGPTLFECELKAALFNRGQGRLYHAKRAARMLCPNRDWHDWTQWRWRALCDVTDGIQKPKWHIWCGSAASGKSHDSVWFAVTWWLMAPAWSAVILTTTTAKMGRKRLWSVVSEIYHELTERGPAIGVFQDSEGEWKAIAGDSKHSISLVAVDQGPLQRAVDKIKGHHCERVLVVIDEGDSTPEAIFSAPANLLAGASREFMVICTANPESRFSQLGQLAEPPDGWGTVSPDVEEYTSRKGALVLHFHGMQSPNVKAGKVVSRHLLNLEQITSIEKQYGRESIEYWRYVVGWFHPDGLSHTIFSEAMFVKSKATEPHWVWYSARVPIASLDPAFTADGDRCPLQFGLLGGIADGRMAIELTDRVLININRESPDPVNDQIARRVIEECEQRGVDPQHFILDDTSGGLGDRLVTMWGLGFIRCHFNAAATDRRVSDDDARLCCDVYANFVTELWFSARWFVEAGLIRGVDPELIRECVARMYWETNRKKQAEPKSASMRGGRRVVGMKDRVGYSPDLADSFCVLVELARQLGAVAKRSPDEPGANRSDDTWDKFAREQNEIYEGTQPPTWEPQYA